MKLPTIKPSQLINILEKKNCILKRQTGSHRIFYCPEKQRIITIPIHNRDIKKGLLHSIIRELDISIEEFVELLRK